MLPLVALAAGLLPVTAVVRPAPSGLDRLIHGVRPYVTLEGRPVGGMMPREVDALLARWARRRDRPPVNASLDRTTGRPLPERDGVAVNRAATRRALLSAWPFARVRLIMRPVPARWRQTDLERLTATLGEYRTWISGSLDRRANIAVATRLIRYRVIYPGEVFSFVAAVGPGTRAQGYRLAPTIQDGQMVPGLGGGVCQVSSTLYNAVVRARLTVVERHHHGLPVHYVPEGQDATVVLPGEHPPVWLPRLDFRFRNGLSRPVYLSGEVQGWRLTLRVVGDPRDRRPAPG